MHKINSANRLKKYNAFSLCHRYIVYLQKGKFNTLS
nr:MAG TPA: hypothetical protein [Caudoviricetes sp.]